MHILIIGAMKPWSDMKCSRRRPGKIAVDPTSDEDAGVELNQKTQLGATGTSGTSAYPTLDGQKVLPSPLWYTSACCSVSCLLMLTHQRPCCMRTTACSTAAQHRV